MDTRMCNLGKSSRGHRSLAGALFVGPAAIFRHGCVPAAIILLAVSCGPSAENNAKNMSTSTSLPENIKFRVPPAVFDARDWPAKLTDAIQKSNEKARLDGLPDYLNPQMLDREKTASFLQA